MGWKLRKLLEKYDENNYFPIFPVNKIYKRLFLQYNIIIKKGEKSNGFENF